jgi:multidrug efflux system outer membrane protein
MRRLIPFLIILLFSGCATMAPERELPPMPVPATWPDESTARADIPGWRDTFPDTALQALIESALHENRNLRQAVLNLDKARAQLGVAHADRWPDVSTSGSSTTNRYPADLSSSGQSGINRQWAVNLGATSFELDFFGRVKSLEDKALEEYLATEEARRAVHIGLVSQIARTYLALAADREGLTLARDTLLSRQETLRLTQARIANGLGTDLERLQAEEAVAVAESEVARLKAQVSMDQNALAVLTGRAVPDLHLPAQTISAVKIVEDIKPGLPSELLTRRPDILEAEHRLWAAGAQIGAARAAFFPRISLTSTVGLASLELTDLFDATQRTWTFIPSFTLPIFDMGRNKANLAAAEAEQDIRLAAYEYAIQNAFREVADNLARNEGYRGQVEAQAKRVSSAGQSRILVEQRYDAGLESLFAVHDAERTLFSARQTLLAARLSQKLNTVDLFAALGGGWEETTPLAAARP